MEDVVENIIGLAILAVALLILLPVFSGWLGRYNSGKVTVYDHEIGLKIEKGAVVETLKAGRYATWPADVEIVRVDLREQTMSIGGQEILTADTLPVRVSGVVTYKITDALKQRRFSDNYYSILYQNAQIALRRRVSVKTLDEVVKDRGALAEGLADELQTMIGDVGLALIKADILDVTLVGPSKQAYADLWKAKKEGEAALERARGEQASLRALANAARMLKGNPELMNLRVLAALSGKPGQAAPNVILGGAPGLVPVTKEADLSAAGSEAGE